MMMVDKVATSFRLTRQARQLLRELAERMGIDQTHVVETAIRDLAERKIKQETGK